MISNWIQEELEYHFKSSFQNFRIYHKHAVGYDDFVNNYSNYSNSALISYRGWTPVEVSDNNEIDGYSDSYSIYLNFPSGIETEQLIKDFRDVLIKKTEFNHDGRYYLLNVLDGNYLPSDKAVTIFEIRLEFICLVL